MLGMFMPDGWLWAKMAAVPVNEANALLIPGFVGDFLNCDFHGLLSLFYPFKTLKGKKGVKIIKVKSENRKQNRLTLHQAFVLFVFSC